jgi:DNA repair exonuclease SbcCD ATPase subunit
MARGLTELDVHHAADDIVSLGERPTVERIRTHLGTGSPNTVTRWLETWWSSVGARLRQRAIETDRPDLPDAVVTLSQRCWNAALEEAREHAHAALAAERTELDQQRALLADQHELRAEEARLLQQANAQVVAAESTIEALQDKLESLVARGKELEAQRDGAYARAERLEGQLQSQQEAQARQHQIDQTERADLMAYTRSTEERLNTELDRVRQDAQALGSRLRQQEGQSRSTVVALEQQLGVTARERDEAITVADQERQRALHLQQHADTLRAMVVTLERAVEVAAGSSVPGTSKRARRTKPTAGQATPAPKTRRSTSVTGKR